MLSGFAHLQTHLHLTLLELNIRPSCALHASEQLREKKENKEQSSLSMSERQTPCTSGSIDACSSPGYTPRQQQQNYDHIQGPPSFLYPENKSYDPTASSRALVYVSLPYNYKHGQYAAAAADSTTTYLPQSGSFTYHAAAWPTSPCAHQQQQPFSPSRTDSQRRTNPYADPYYASRLDSRIERGYSCLVGATQVYYERSPQ